MRHATQRKALLPSRRSTQRFAATGPALRVNLRVGDLRVPIDGLAGSLWRTATLPFRASAPLVLLAKRAITGRVWDESTTADPNLVRAPRLSEHDDIQNPADGAGPIVHRLYEVAIRGSQLAGDDLVEMFRTDPNRFCPNSFATFVPNPAPRGLHEGDRFDVKLPGPWDGPVLVSSVNEHTIRLETLVGHMEAGWIEFFAAQKQDDVLEFQIESYARSGDPLFDALYRLTLIPRLVQTEMWVRVLEAMVAASGGRQHGRIRVTTTIYERSAR